MSTNLDLLISEATPTAPTICESARAELDYLRAIREAARLFVFADGRGNPTEKYQALKALLEKTK